MLKLNGHLGGELIRNKGSVPNWLTSAFPLPQSWLTPQRLGSMAFLKFDLIS